MISLITRTHSQHQWSWCVCVQQSLSQFGAADDGEGGIEGHGEQGAGVAHLCGGTGVYITM